ncbi:MAG: hypothetical protein M3Y42_17545 [Actinomycetota bacterium]|nr:hypothetical protein [Actinomycetota bacterium]
MDNSEFALDGVDDLIAGLEARVNDGMLLASVTPPMRTQTDCTHTCICNN